MPQSEKFDHVASSLCSPLFFLLWIRKLSFSTYINVILVDEECYERCRALGKGSYGKVRFS
jgi:hypothetical protein